MMLEKQRADVLLTDICMFNVSGLDVARIIFEKYPWMKVILFSGYREFEYAKEALRYNVYDYLVKPIEYQKLKELFIELKQIFDAENYEEQILRGFGEKEYGQLLDLIKMVSNSVLGEGDENWLAYVRMKPVMNNAPFAVRKVLVKRLLEQLKNELWKRDSRVALWFENRIQVLDISGNIGEQITELLLAVNDRLMELGFGYNSVKGHDDVILKACQYISNHLNEEITYKEVAGFVYLSPRHFLRRFKAETGERFSDYIMHARVNRALQLIDEKNIPYADICHMVGYRDEKYFQNLFKKVVGCTMHEYIRSKE